MSEFEIDQIEKSMPQATFELFTEGFSNIEYIRNWTLVGGTALSLHLQHRLSEDLDFFIEKSTLDQERTHIERMISKLDREGYNCIETHNDRENLSYEIEGVKVTFFSSGLETLKSNCLSCKHIEVASIETIAAMKIEAILSYRTKTRDFYDIYTICKDQDITLFDMLDIYNKYSDKKKKEELIYTRFVTKALDSNDEGLSNMGAREKSMSTFHRLREWITDEIKNKKEEESEKISKILDDPLQIQDYKDFKFGLQRMSLPQKLSSIGRSDMVLKCLELNIFDLAYEDISGKNLLDYYLTAEGNKMFEKILRHTFVIPAKWLENKTYRREGKIDAIRFENSIITSIKNNQGNDRMEIVAKKHDMSLEEYLQKMEEKKIIFYSRDQRDN